MLISREHPQFQPSSSILQAMTWVRRTKLRFPVDQYGLFGEHLVGRDYALFSMAIIAEVIGIFMITRYMPIKFAIGLILAALVIDILLAVWHHRLTCPRIFEVRKYVSNLEALSKSGDDKRIAAGYAQRINKKKAWSLIPSIGLVAMTAVKIFFFFIVNGRRIDTTLFGMASVYIVMCIIHLRVTGYTLAHIRASGWFGLWGYDSELKAYESDTNNVEYTALEHKQPIVGSAAYQEALTKIQAQKSAPSPGQQLDTVRSHKLEFNNTTDGLVLVSHGVLYDTDITELMNKFTATDAQTELAKAALMIQAHKIITE